MNIISFTTSVHFICIITYCLVYLSFGLMSLKTHYFGQGEVTIIG